MLPASPLAPVPSPKIGELYLLQTQSLNLVIGLAEPEPPQQAEEQSEVNGPIPEWRKIPVRIKLSRTGGK